MTRVGTNRTLTPWPALPSRLDPVDGARSRARFSEADIRRTVGGTGPAWPTGSAQRAEGATLIAPGVRMAPLDEAPAVPPSRAERADLVPNPRSVVPPSAYAETGPALLRAIRDRGQMTEQLGYRPAREAMFRVVDNVRGIVEGIYTGRRVRTRGIPSADGKHGMNTEHAWPQSKGVKGTPAKYDLHHLFPANTYANGRRGNFPFGVVGDQVRWSENGSKLGRDDRGQVVFEPREGTRGTVARALFYISAVYGLALPEREEAVLRAWHAAEPPTAREVTRNDEISRYQGNRNPFIDQPALVDRIERFA